MTVASALSRVAGAAFKAVAIHRLDALRRASDPAGRMFANAIGAALSGRATAEEAALIARIEALRAREASSDQVLQVIDYGAGSRKNQHSAEQAARGVETTRTVAAASRAARPPFWCLLIMHLIRETRPATCVELGTSLGISAAYTSGAQQLDGQGHTVTLEGAPAIAERAADNLAGLGLDNVRVVPGPFHDTLAAVLEAEAPVDWVFVDGHHEEHATLRYFEQLLPHLSDRAIVAFDDISWSAGMRRAWRRVIEHPAVSLSVDLRLLGVCAVSGTGAKAKEHFELPLH